MHIEEISSGGRICLVIWSLFPLLLGLPGNLLILYSSIKHTAFQFDRVSVLLIQQIALVDICHIVLVVGPTCWSLLTDQGHVATFFNSNCVGKVLCFTVGHAQYWLPLTGAALISSLNVSKLLCLIFPLNVPQRSTLWALVLAVLAWSTLSASLLSCPIKWIWSTLLGTQHCCSRFGVEQMRVT